MANAFPDKWQPEPTLLGCSPDRSLVTALQPLIIS